MQGLVKTKLYTLCQMYPMLFNIRNGDISDVNQLSKTVIHVKNEKQMRSTF